MRIHVTREGDIYDRPLRADRWGRCSAKLVGVIHHNANGYSVYQKRGRGCTRFVVAGPYRLLADAKEGAREFFRED